MKRAMSFITAIALTGILTIVGTKSLPVDPILYLM
ncbi:hypothetical protein SAAL107622_09500 [Lacicoccus alkaliphilus]